VRVFAAVHELGDDKAPWQQWRSGCLLAALLWRAEERRKRQSACGGQPGVIHFKTASMRRGQDEPGAWRPRGGHHLTSVGHDRSEARVSDFNSTD